MSNAPLFGAGGDSAFTFAPAAAFGASASPAKDANAADDVETTGADNEDAGADFKPIYEGADKVDVKTGEEG